MCVVRRGAALLAMVVVVWASSAYAMAEAPSVEELFSTLKASNPGLQDYQSDIHIDLQVKFGVAIPLDLHGKYYYKKPDHYKLILERAPKFVQKYPQVFGWNLPKLENFNSRIMGEETIDGMPCYHVFLTPRHPMADLLGQELWIDKKEAVFPRQIVHYKDNGVITINVTYLTKDGYHLFDKMNATFDFPKMHVTTVANADYSNYATNQHLSDSFFESAP